MDGSEIVWQCQHCESLGDELEILENDGGETEFQAWIYCKACDIETFHPIADV